MMPTIERDGAALAYAFRPGERRGKGPITVFLPGYRSDMGGAKALAADCFCAAHGLPCLRLDYSGHGQSGGRFEDGSIGRWTADAAHVIDQVTGDAELLLVGSSMGGWIALLLALGRPERVTGLVGIAAAPDFTEALMWAAMTPAEQAHLMANGVLLVPSQYGDPVPVTRTLIEDGRQHLLLGAPIPIHAPVRLLQGQQDRDVPWQTALRLAERLEADDVQVSLIKDGDHRLSRRSDLALLRRVLGSLLLEDGA